MSPPAWLVLFCFFPTLAVKWLGGTAQGKCPRGQGPCQAPLAARGRQALCLLSSFGFMGLLYLCFLLNLPRIWWHHCPHRGVFTARPSCDCPPCPQQTRGTFPHAPQCLLVAHCLLPALGKDGGIASTRSPQAHEAGGCTNTPGLTGFKELA